MGIPRSLYFLGFVSPFGAFLVHIAIFLPCLTGVRVFRMFQMEGFAGLLVTHRLCVVWCLDILGLVVVGLRRTLMSTMGVYGYVISFLTF